MYQNIKRTSRATVSSLFYYIQFYCKSVTVMRAKVYFLLSAEPDMRLLEILVLVGMCLAFVKAESNEDTEFDELFNAQSADESFTEDETANTAQDAPLKEDPNEKARRQFRRSTVYLSMGIPSNINSAYFSLCYCFRRRCYGK